MNRFDSLKELFLQKDATGSGIFSNPVAAATNFTLASSSATVRAKYYNPDPNADDDVDAADRGSIRRRGQVGYGDMLARDIEQMARILVEEMVVIADIGVEIGAPGADHHLA